MFKSKNINIFNICAIYQNLYEDIKLLSSAYKNINMNQIKITLVLGRKYNGV